MFQASAFSDVYEPGGLILLDFVPCWDIPSSDQTPPRRSASRSSMCGGFSRIGVYMEVALDGLDGLCKQGSRVVRVFQN